MHALMIFFPFFAEPEVGMPEHVAQNFFKQLVDGVVRMLFMCDTECA